MKKESKKNALKQIRKAIYKTKMDKDMDSPEKKGGFSVTISTGEMAKKKKDELDELMDD